MKEVIKQQLDQAAEVLNIFKCDEHILKSIENAANMMVETLQGGGKIICCGNGGSLCDATHFAEELTARFRSNRAAMAAIAINDSAFFTCVGNDFSFDEVFSRYVEAMGNQGDLLLAISTSGNSKNIVKAINQAHIQNMRVVALTGKNGGAVGQLSDIEIRAPFTEYSDRAQEIHIKVIHILVHLIELQYGLY